jgi:hypothetical protein
MNETWQNHLWLGPLRYSSFPNKFFERVTYGQRGDRASLSKSRYQRTKQEKKRNGCTIPH